MPVMKRTVLSLLLFCGLALLTACGNKAVFDETHTITGAWNRFEPENFTVDIQNAEELYDLFLCVSVDTARYRENSLPIHVNVISPVGERRMFPCSITLRDRTGAWKGEWRDGLLVVDKRVRECFSFNREGEHSITVGQGTHYYDINGIRSLRLRLSPTEMEYPE